MASISKVVSLQTFTNAIYVSAFFKYKYTVVNAVNKADDIMLKNLLRKFIV